MEIDTPVLAAMGAVVIVATMVDLVWTAIGVGERRGPVSDAVAGASARLGRVGSPTHRRRKFVGVATAVAVPAAWLLLLWAGLALMFLSDDDAVLVSASQQPVGVLGRLAFAAGSLAGAATTLAAGTETWELVNNIAAVAGLVLVTLSLTYLLQVVSAVVDERSVMSQVAALGPRPDDAVARALATPHAGTFPLQLVMFAQGISDAGQRHLAFPMLQYFHSDSPTTSPEVNLVRYDAMLTELEERAGDEHGSTIAAGRGAIDEFLRTILIHDAPPGASREQRLHAFLEQEGWTWDDVMGRSGR